MTVQDPQRPARPRRLVDQHRLQGALLALIVVLAWSRPTGARARENVPGVPGQRDQDAA